MYRVVGQGRAGRSFRKLDVECRLSLVEKWFVVVGVAVVVDVDVG